MYKLNRNYVKSVQLNSVGADNDWRQRCDSVFLLELT